MNETTHTPDAGVQPSVGHELSDVRPRNIALFAAALAATVLVVLAVSYLLFKHGALRYATQQAPPSPLAHTREPTPEPRLQVQGAKDLLEMRAAENAVLNSYAWIDRESGIVRIPVDRAIEVLAKKGLPMRQERDTRQVKSQRQKDDAFRK